MIVAWLEQMRFALRVTQLAWQQYYVLTCGPWWFWPGLEKARDDR